MIKLGVLGSTNGTDLQAILESIKDKKINASVKIVISNQEHAFILERAKTQGVKACFVSHKNKTREEFDREVTSLLEEHNVELILLIGFMRILSQEFCHRWQDKILNVHPSLLPKYAGGMDTNVHEEVLLNGEIETGCTIHFVTEDVDSGPILIQKSCAVEENDTVETLKKKVQALEGQAFVEAINLVTNKSYAR
tara:strand:- start:1778 stop:2362 length:585 start_codon:yes stop_codon:yes gene_type:complete